MAAHAAEKSEGLEPPEGLEGPENKPLAKAVDTAMSLKGERLRIDALLSTISEKKGARKATIEEYRKAAAADQSAEGLKEFYKWIQKSWETVQDNSRKVIDELDQAVSGKVKVMNAQDRRFLISHLVAQADVYDFIDPKTQEKVSKFIREKIEHAKEDRKAYDNLMQHPLVRDKKAISGAAGQPEIKIFAEADFMKLSLPERRTKIEEWTEALKKAEGVTKLSEAAEAVQVDGKYTEKLKKAMADKLIGKKTYDHFLNRKPDGFKHQTLDKKRQYLQDFDAQMERYEKFWSDVKENLRPESQQHLQGMRDRMGYKELMKEYEKREGKDKARNEKEYSVKLTAARKGTGGKEAKGKPIIGKHTFDEFMAGFKKQSAKEQTHWNKPEVFAKQMERYQKLWEGIEKDLPASKQNELRRKQDTLGYTQLNELYQHYKSGTQGNASGMAVSVQAERVMKARVTDVSKQQGIDSFVGEIGKSEKRFNIALRIFRTMVNRGEQGNVNASGLQNDLAQKRSKNSKELATRYAVNLGRGEGYRVAPTDTKSGNSDKPRISKVINEWTKGYKEVDVATKDGISHQARVTMNQKEGLQHLFSRQQETHIDSQIRDGRSRIQWTVKRSDGTSNDLKWKEILATKEMLEEMQRSGRKAA